MDPSPSTFDFSREAAVAVAAVANTGPRTPARKQKAQSAPSSTGRGGCYTCRVRRKKCDEQDTDGACQTCIRLRIECLGWGPKRPAWLRDKAAVDKYKSDIKAQLMERGMIRGQPRTNLNSVQAPGQMYSLPIGNVDSYMHHQVQFQVEAAQNAAALHEMIRQQQRSHGLSAPARLMWDAETTYAADAADVFLVDFEDALNSSHPLGSNILQQPLTDSPTQASYGPERQPTHVDSAIVPSQQHPFDFIGDHVLQPLSPPTSLSSTRENHVLYYFRRVRRMQYVFAGPDITSTFHDVIVRDPHGAVTSAICSLAAVHNARLRVASGLDNGDPTLDRRFYEDAFWQINRSKQLHGRFTENDATAAVHAISYWLFQGGTSDWDVPLNVARDWLASSPVAVEESPLVALLQCDDTSRFASRATMWFDIFSSITTVTPPRFLDMYRRLFKGDAGKWASTIAAAQGELRMDGLMGCPDEVMLAIAEVANLAYWKSNRVRTGRLSIRELVTRADAIEKELRTQETLRTWSRNVSSVSYNEFDRQLQEPELASTLSASTAPSSSIPSPGSGGLLSPMPQSANLAHIPSPIPTPVSHTAPSLSPHILVMGATPLPIVPSMASPHQAAASLHPLVTSLSPHPTSVSPSPFSMALSPNSVPVTLSPHPGAMGSSPLPFSSDTSPVSGVTGPSPASAVTGASPLPPVTSLPSTQSREDDMRDRISIVFRDAAILYLYTVMSPFPDVFEISEAVKAIIEGLTLLPPSEYDRSLVFPICLAGCMSNDAAQREYLRQRLLAHESAIGNVGTVLQLMEAVWERRDKSGCTVNWIDVMREMGISLLLV